jgi:hypothetical protein
MNTDPRNRDRYGRFEEALRRDVDERGVCWEALLGGCINRIERIERIEREWGPLAILACSAEPPANFWERVETGMSRRIACYEEYEQPVDECIDSAQDLPDNQWDRLESKLEAAIEDVERQAPWEQALRADAIMTEGAWESIEERLMDQLDAHERRQRKINDLSVKASWPAWSTLVRATGVRTALVAAATVLATGGGLLWHVNRPAPTPTYVYQAHGADIDLAGAAVQPRTAVRSRSGGALRMVNRHGYAHLQNGASLTVERATEREARYRLSLRGDDNAVATGKAAFFVARRSERARFTLSTDDYDISVLGTYFRIIPDLAGNAATEVLEGRVRIHSSQFGDTVLEAGQSLSFDARDKRYIITGGGPVAARDAIDGMPDIGALDEYGVVSITASIPFADVTIDGEYRGSTPLRTLLAPGKRQIRISSDSYAAIDTVMTVGRRRAEALYAALSPETPALPRADSAKLAAARPVTPARSAATAPSPSLDSVTVEPPHAVDARELLEQAQAAESGHWRKALSLYQKIAASEGVSPIVRQTALFAIGKLQAERKKSVREAKETFLRYLALYPSGAFTREALLRLAEIEFERDRIKAIEYYLKYFEKYPNHYRVPELQYRVGLIYAQEKQHDAAIYMFKQSLANMIHDRPDMRKRIYSSLHNAFIATGDSTRAARMKKQLSTLD